jgi:hypothetical protein
MVGSCHSLDTDIKHRVLSIILPNFQGEMVIATQSFIRGTKLSESRDRFEPVKSCEASCCPVRDSPRVHAAFSSHVQSDSGTPGRKDIYHTTTIICHVSDDELFTNAIAAAPTPQKNWKRPHSLFLSSRGVVLNVDRFLERGSRGSRGSIKNLGVTSLIRPLSR